MGLRERGLAGLRHPAPTGVRAVGDQVAREVADDPDVEVLLAIVSVIGTVAVAVIARLPGVTSADRKRAALKADLELVALLPDGQREEVRQAVDDSVKAFISEQRRGRDWERLPLLALAMIIAGMGMFVLADAATDGSVDVASTVAYSLLAVAVALVFGAVLFEVAYVVVLAHRGWRWLAKRWRDRRAVARPRLPKP